MPNPHLGQLNDQMLHRIHLSIDDPIRRSNWERPPWKRKIWRLWWQSSHESSELAEKKLGIDDPFFLYSRFLGLSCFKMLAIIFGSVFFQLRHRTIKGTT